MDAIVAQVDLNSDLGEVWRGTPMADDDAMFRIVTSANVACGFHAGSAATMLESVRRAVSSGVALGAHPSYRDEPGFGRRDQDVPPAVLEADVFEQLGALQLAVETAAADAAADGVPGAIIDYVKPHGALYNRIARDPLQAAAVVRAVVAFGERIGRPLPVLGLAGTAIESAVRAAGGRFVSEAFVDRGYLPDGSLVPRDAPGALITEHSVAVARAVGMVLDRAVTAVDGTRIELAPESLCVHGDTPGSVALAGSVRSALLDAGIDVRAPW